MVTQKTRKTHTKHKGVMKMKKNIFKMMKTTLSILMMFAMLFQFMDLSKIETKATADVITGVEDINTARYANYILLEDRRTLLTSGYNGFRKLARPEKANGAATEFGTADTSMVQGEIQSISVSETNGIIVDDFGNVYVAGDQTYGQAGNSATNATYLPKFQLMDTSAIKATGTQAVKVYAGDYNVFVLDGLGNLWATGYNGLGQLGLGNTTNVNKLTKVQGVSNVIDVMPTKDPAEASSRSTFILQADGLVFATGNNGNGIFGRGNATASNSFIKYPIENVKQIMRSNYNIMVLTHDGELYASGENRWGMFGNGSGTSNFNTPQNISKKLRESTVGGKTRSWNVEKILSFNTASWIQLDDGTVWSAGTNNGSWGDLGYRFTTRTTVCGGENECWFHQNSDPVQWDQESARGKLLYKSDIDSSGFDINSPTNFAGTWEGGVLIDKNKTLLIVGNSNYGELGLVRSASSGTVFGSINVGRFIFNPTLNFYNETGKLPNTATIIDPLSIEVGPKQYDTEIGAPEVRAFYKIYQTSTPGTVLRNGETSIKDGPMTITVSNLKLKPDDYTVEIYRETVDKKLKSTIIAKDFKLTVPLSEPSISADNIVIQKGAIFNPVDGVTVQDEFRDDITGKLVVKSNPVDVNKLGTYTVTYEAQAAYSLVTKSRKVTVVDEESVYDDRNVIRANNWTIQKTEVSELTDAKILANGQAIAWEIETNTPLAITVIKNMIEEKVGAYQVQYAAGTVSKEVIVSVIGDNTEIDEDKNTALDASDFNLDISEVSGLTEDAIKVKANAIAWNLKDGSDIAFTADYTEIQNAKGVYDVVFTTETGVVKTVKVTVTDAKEIVSTEIVATNFILNISDVTAIWKGNTFLHKFYKDTF